MKPPLFTTIQARVTEEFAGKFRGVCRAAGKPVSDTLREFMEDFMVQYEIKSLKSEIEMDVSIETEVTVGEPYGRGKADKDEFYVKAEIALKQASNYPLLDNEIGLPEIRFLLPEFKDENGAETYRVDSFYYHRDFFPGCRNENGRYIGAKLIEENRFKWKWEGAIFLYDYRDVNDPIAAKLAIKTELERTLIKAVTDTLNALKEVLGVRPAYNNSSFEYKFCTITFQHKEEDDYGAWRMTMALKEDAFDKTGQKFQRLTIPNVPQRILHFDGRNADYSANQSPGFRIVDGTATGYVYSNGIAEELNEVSLAEVAAQLNTLIEKRRESVQERNDSQ